MAMGVDEAGQQDDFAEVQDFFARGAGRKFFHGATARILLPAIKTAPSSMGGAVTGRTIFARRIILR